MSFPSDNGRKLFSAAVLDSELSSELRFLLPEGDSQLLLLTLAGVGSSEFGQFQGLPEAILNRLSFCLKSFLQTEMFGSWKKLLYSRREVVSPNCVKDNGDSEGRI